MRLPGGLLEQAQHLARREPKRPKQASLRRAISTSYYALFHLLISEAVLNWRRAEDRVELARMFEHAHMRSICASKRDELNKEFKKKKTAGRPNQEEAVKRSLHRVANTFVQMHEQRELADYDYSSNWTRTDVLPKVEGVAAAFKAWKAIRNEDIAQAFLFALLCKKRR
ncbi:MAG TPA: hypothetical protein VMI94_18655 [Bryobacteraceae bacterium]|nr:hypothetical protein [Bryobacteraceae bacterium]